MAPVPPGDKTGVYKFNYQNMSDARAEISQCSWQKLKDFARNHPDGTYLNVDHAYVYPGSNSNSSQMCSGYGWVRIKGKADFKKALAYLNGGVFENRPLMADGRNETETTHLRDIASTEKSQTRRRQDSIAISDHLAAPPHYQYSPTSTLDTTYGRQGFYENWFPPPQQFFNATSLSTTFSTSSSFYYSSPPPYEVGQGNFQISNNQEFNSIPATTAFYVGSVTSVYPCIASPMTYMSSPPGMQGSGPSTDGNFSFNALGGIVQPEARKIIITRLSHDIKDADLNFLLRRVSTKYRPSTQMERETPIHSVTLARYPDGKPKGHAFVVYESTALAEHAVSILNGMKFQSRSLSAKLAKEGVEPVAGYVVSDAHWQAPQDKHTKEASGITGIDVQAERIENQIEGEKIESEQVKEKQGKGKEDWQPLVVDGSGSSKLHR